MGPGADECTDGEHPPVYIPSLTSDNRAAMSKVGCYERLLGGMVALIICLPCDPLPFAGGFFCDDALLLVTTVIICIYIQYVFETRYD